MGDRGVVASAYPLAFLVLRDFGLGLGFLYPCFFFAGWLFVYCVSLLEFEGNAEME
jgi:hypothetical protein